MKIIKKDEKIAKKEADELARLKVEEKAREEYLNSLRKNKLFQKYVIDEILKKELNRITNIEWMYESEHLGESSNSRVGEIIRRNSIVLRTIKNILKPLMNNED